MQEKIVETKNCKHCNSSFEITDKDLEFYDKVSPKFNDRKYSIPTPTLCPNCRQQRRLSFRNERNLYKRDCDATWKEIISIYSPDKKIKVYNQEEWWSDSWDAMDYWIDFDFSKNFFEQFLWLSYKVPKISLYGNNNERSNYWNDITNNKDCYLIFGSDYNENCLYGAFNNSKNSLDFLESSNLENSYECVNCDWGHNLFYSKDSNNCSNSRFLINCNNCEYCFLSSNLQNKKYFILNKQFSKKEYFSEIKKYSLNESKKLYKKLQKNSFYKNLTISNSEDCFWNYISNSKNCDYCFDTSDAIDCKYIYFWSQKLSDCMDTVMASINASKCYEVQTCLENCHNIIWCNFCNNISFSYYIDSCVNCKNCFWCIWLRNKQYCILNKQYTKEEYETLVPQIIEHMQKYWEWWEFFPSSISPFWYNEIVAQEYFPLTKEEAKHKWFNWSDYEPPKPNVEKIIPAEKLPIDIKDIPDDILNWAIMPEKNENPVGTADLLSLQPEIQKPFRIIKQELEFYRKHNLPIPRKHPDQRHLERIQLRNPRKLFDRKCDKCWIEMKTTYSPDSKEMVYCEKCYNEEIF